MNRIHQAYELRDNLSTFFKVTSSFSGFPHLQPRVQQWWGVGPHGQVQLCLWRGHRVRPVHPDLQLPRECLPLRREPQPLWGCGVWKGHGGLLNVTGKTIYKTEQRLSGKQSILWYQFIFSYKFMILILWDISSVTQPGHKLSISKSSPYYDDTLGIFARRYSNKVKITWVQHDLWSI